MKIIYSEAWKQYSHEEVLSHTKNTFYLSSHGAMLAILTGLASVLIKLNYNANGYNLYFGAMILGVLSIIVGILGLSINKTWKHVNDAHRAGAIIRWMTTRAVELQSGLSDFGPASIEHKWRSHRSTSQGLHYPFKDIPGLDDLQITGNLKIGGYSAINGVIKAVTILWYIIISLAFIAIIITGMIAVIG